MQTALDNVVHDDRFLPYAGWHDDYRWADRTDSYRPAMQQNRGEIHALWEVLRSAGLNKRCLQLGLGVPGASHLVFQQMFTEVVTVERDQGTIMDLVRRVGPVETIIAGDTQNPETMRQVSRCGGHFDFLFIDAGHYLDQVHADFFGYRSFVRGGGIIAFHDAVKRPTYEHEIEVWRFLDDLRKDKYQVNMIGDEIGIGWIKVGW